MNIIKVKIIPLFLAFQGISLRIYKKYDYKIQETIARSMITKSEKTLSIFSLELGHLPANNIEQGRKTIR